MENNNIKELKNMFEENKELQELLFIRGFLLTDDKNINVEVFPFYANWNKLKIDDRYDIYVHKKQKATIIEVNGNKFFLLGHAYNPFTMEYKENKILQRIGEAYNTDRFQDYIDELTGVFVFGYVVDGQLEFEADATEIQSAYCGKIHDKFYLSSHAQLIGDLCNLKMSDIAKELVEYKWYYRVLGPYLPGNLSQYNEVKRIVPNQLYLYKNGELRHSRFFPVRDIPLIKNEKEYNKIISDGAKILKNNMKLVAEKWKNPQISLSGGIDSNTTFAAANGFYDEFETFSYVSAEKETIDAEAAKKIADKFGVKHTLYEIPEDSKELDNYNEIVDIIDHNNGYIAKGRDNEYRKRVYLLEHLDADVEIKSWVSELIRGDWHTFFNRKEFPELSGKLYRNLYKIFIFNRKLAHKVDEIFNQFIQEFEYNLIPEMYDPSYMFEEVGWGSWGGINISEMKIYSDITIIYNNRKFLDMMFRLPLEYRMSDQNHLDMKKILNKDLYDMGSCVTNMKETRFRSFSLNVLFTLNSLLP